MAITVTGALRHAAEARRSTADEWSVHALIDQERGLPVEVRVACGTGLGGAHTAQTVAAQYRRGDRVQAAANCALVRTDHSYAALVLQGNVTLAASV